MPIISDSADEVIAYTGMAIMAAGAAYVFFNAGRLYSLDRLTEFIKKHKIRVTGLDGKGKVKDMNSGDLTDAL